MAGLHTPVLHQAQQFVIGNVNPLQADRCSGIGRLEKHIPTPQQAFSARLVNNNAAVGSGGNGKGNAGREVGLDQARDHIDRGALSRNNHVNAGGAR